MNKFSRYRKWGWELAKSIFKCTTSGRYTTTVPIQGMPHKSEWTDGYHHQALLSETFKVNIFIIVRINLNFIKYFMQYLYLLFCEDDIFPLDKWIFNANGHPLPIKGTLASFQSL